MWRHLTQFLGGQGIVVTALSLSLGLRGGAFSLYMAEGRDEHIVPNVLQTARFIWIVTLVYVVSGTVAAFAILMSLGMPLDRGALHAFWISVAAFDTGGFAPQRMNMMYYHNWMVEIVALVLMMAGSINFGLHAMVWRGGRRELRRNLEIRILVLVATTMIMLVTVGLAFTDWGGGAVGLFRKGVFQIISGQSAGHQTVYPSQLLLDFSGIGLLAVVLAMAAGGSMSSTGGGFKALRIGLMWKSMLHAIRETMAPPSASLVTRYRHLGDRMLTSQMTAVTSVIVLLYFVTYVTGSLIGMAYGYESAEAVFESVSATANSGLSIGVTSAEMPRGLKLTYMFEMWAGRLEFVSVLALGAQLLSFLNPRRLERLAG
jgi:trk system potassium uptake protein TrkH